MLALFSKSRVFIIKKKEEKEERVRRRRRKGRINFLSFLNLPYRVLVKILQSNMCNKCTEHTQLWLLMLAAPSFPVSKL